MWTLVQLAADINTIVLNLGSELHWWQSRVIYICGTFAADRCKCRYVLMIWNQNQNLRVRWATICVLLPSPVLSLPTCEHNPVGGNGAWLNMGSDQAIEPSVKAPSEEVLWMKFWVYSVDVHYSWLCEAQLMPWNINTDATLIQGHHFRSKKTFFFRIPAS